MKLYKYFLLLAGVLPFIGCEDVVEVDLDQTAPRLVVEASILWEKGSDGNNQYIRLTETTGFFEDEIPPAEGASITIFSEDGKKFDFEEVQPGIYKTDDFNPEFNSNYELELIYQDEVYQATETFIPVPSFEFVEQSNDGGFGGDDIELKVYFADPPDEANYYLARFFYEDLSLQIYDDQFTDGNLTFAYFTSEDLLSGDDVSFEIQGISRRFYEYLFILRSQSGSNGGGPFQTQPTIVRGNIINVTNPDNYAFGYFRLSETDFLDYTIE